MRVVILSLLLVGVAVTNVAFEEWTKQHDKVYSSWGEKEYRRVSVIFLAWSLLHELARATAFRQKKGQK